jgi:hypothetical protein
MSVVYRRFGGSTHVRVDTFAQLKEAVNVPETQWVAISAPLSSFAADEAFLTLLDSDHNARIRVNELQAAVVWLSGLLSADVGVDTRSATLTLAHLTPAAGAIKRAAEAVLDVLGASDRSTVALDQVRAAQGPLRAAGRNGDGVVAPTHVPAAAQALATQIVSLCAETKNRAGIAGVSPEHLAAFRTAKASFLAHVAHKDAVCVWGEDSRARALQVQAVTDVLDEHFLLCRLVASQPDARERFRLAADRIESLVGNRAAMQVALAALPVAPPDPAGVLAFSTVHRGPHLEALQAFAADVLTATPGRDKQLTEATWSSLKATAAGIVAWQQAHDTHQLAPIAASVAAIADADLDAIGLAQQKDLDDKVALDAIDDLEKVLLLQRFLLAFANSFLAMPDLYTSHRALYERGHAVLAGRRYELSLLVPDVGAHKAHTEQGTTCVVYCKVFDTEGSPGFDVVLPKTRGWSSELAVGKRGLFYDLDNKEHDLVVTDIVRRPVSVVEAALSPFLRIGEFVNKKLEGLNTGVDGAVEEHSAALGSTFEGTQAAAAAALARAPQPAPAVASPAALPTSTAGPAMGNALAMGGLAVAAVGSSVAFVAAQLKALSVADLVSIVVVAFAAIAGPSGFVGWLRLRRRNLAQLLEGAGWALNDRLRVTPALAARVTQTPSRVAGSSLEIGASPPVPGEPEDSHVGWKLAAAVAVVALVLWQVREPLLRVGCHSGWVHGGVCLAAGVEISTGP